MSENKKTTPKRPLRICEVVLVVTNDALTKAGFMRVGSVAHIGRVDRKNGPVISIACGNDSRPRWTYHFHPFGAAHMPICGGCVRALVDNGVMVDGRPLADFFPSPASNTGVN